MILTQVLPLARRPREAARTRPRRRAAARRATPGLEAMESLMLLSGTGTALPQLAAASAASLASSVVQTVSVNSSGQAYPVTQVLPQVADFNPSAGTLTSVTVQLNGSITSNVQVTNPNAQPITATVQVVGGVTLQSSPLPAALNSSFPVQTATSTTIASDGTYNFPPVTASGSTSATYTDAATLAAFTGAGTVSPGTTVTTATVFPSSTNGSQISSAVQTSSVATVTITYNFTLPPASVSGYVYVDANKDGLRQTGETGLGGVTVVLTGTNDLGAITPITTTTSTDGSYDFTGLRPGDYTVTEPPPEPAGFTQGLNTRGNVTPLPYDSTVDAIPNIVVVAGQNAVENDFGKLVALPPPGAGGSALSGFVYDDTNNPDGIKEPGEPGLGSVVVTLTGTDEFGRSVSSTLTTNSDGSYFFGGLYGGTYTVTEGASPANFHHGLTATNNIVIPNSYGTGLIPNVALTDGVTLPNNNFAELLTNSPQTPCGPLYVTNVQRYGLHNQPTELVISFNEHLDPATATNLANYQIRRLTNRGVPYGPPIAIKSAVYNDTNHTVVLILAAPLNVHYPYQLTVNGVTDACGDGLRGDGTNPGTAYVTKVSRTILAGFLDNSGNLIPVNNGQFTPGTKGLVPGVGSGTAASNAGYPVQVSNAAKVAAAKAVAAAKLAAAHAVAATKLAAARAVAVAKVAAAKAHAIQVAAVRAASSHRA